MEKRSRQENEDEIEESVEKEEEEEDKEEEEEEIEEGKRITGTIRQKFLKRFSELHNPENKPWNEWSREDLITLKNLLEVASEFVLEELTSTRLDTRYQNTWREACIETLIERAEYDKEEVTQFVDWVISQLVRGPRFAHKTEPAKHGDQAHYTVCTFETKDGVKILVGTYNFDYHRDEGVAWQCYSQDRDPNLYCSMVLGVEVPDKLPSDKCNNYIAGDEFSVGQAFYADELLPLEKVKAERPVWQIVLSMTPFNNDNYSWN